MLDVVASTPPDNKPQCRKGRIPPSKLRGCALIIAAHYRMQPGELFVRSQAWHIAHPRQHLMSLLRDEGYSWGAIGVAFGVDHTTVIYGVRSHMRRRG